jgi:hypothetical protein
LVLEDEDLVGEKGGADDVEIGVYKVLEECARRSGKRVLPRRLPISRVVSGY